MPDEKEQAVITGVSVALNATMEGGRCLSRASSRAQVPGAVLISWLSPVISFGRQGLPAWRAKVGVYTVSQACIIQAVRYDVMC